MLLKEATITASVAATIAATVAVDCYENINDSK